MCSECHQAPCDARCPNAPEPQVVYECNSCGDDIVTGDKYVEIEFQHICEGCLDNMTVSDLLKLLNAYMMTAEVPE